jgi:hypothetical protein
LLSKVNSTLIGSCFIREVHAKLIAARANCKSLEVLGSRNESFSKISMVLPFLMVSPRIGEAWYTCFEFELCLFAGTGKTWGNLLQG